MSVGRIKSTGLRRVVLVAVFPLVMLSIPITNLWGYLVEIWDDWKDVIRVFGIAWKENSHA